MLNKELILGIESSCDDSSVALMDAKTYELVFYKKITQESEHAKFGGVVPELAARLHTATLPNLALELKPYFKDIKAIAVTNEPGLSVSLIGGVSMAKALSISLNVPLIAVNHLIGHIYSLFLNSKSEFPLGVLLASGGHTMVLEISKDAKVNVLVATSDDSYGESFDKVAKMMGLGYPGGPLIEKAALACSKDKFNFTIPLKNDKTRLEYSFSGLKNQVRLAVNDLGENLNNEQISEISYSFQKAATAHIIDKLKIIFKKYKFSSFGVVGGASANLTLRSKLESLSEIYNTKLLLTPLKFCSDNAAMIARVGVEKYKKGEFISYKELQIHPRSNLDGIYIL
ncbi:MAG: tRNA (adenosine(37)-N6)-threonylcarbamoyltransferase complex transferase subunit TsaD [Campylobacter sp.]|nr:tRNA (adenosine(37)-N6)-threonylcarbamoyltransferase complex transferase subunit TsaD [Campylobacter sp.]